MMEKLLELPFIEIKQLIIRWVNHLLRSFNEMRLVYNLEAKFRSKFTKDNKLQNADEENKSDASRSPTINA